MICRCVFSLCALLAWSLLAASGGREFREEPLVRRGLVWGIVDERRAGQSADARGRGWCGWCLTSLYEEEGCRVGQSGVHAGMM